MGGIPQPPPPPPPPGSGAKAQIHMLAPEMARTGPAPTTNEKYVMMWNASLEQLRKSEMTIIVGFVFIFKKRTSYNILGKGSAHPYVTHDLLCSVNTSVKQDHILDINFHALLGQSH